jgi:hypothetical protein
VQAGQVKLNKLGMGVEQPGEVTAEDDIFEQYKKRMMLGYHYHLNPLESRSFYPKMHCSLLSQIELPFRICFLTYTQLFRMVFLREWMSCPLNTEFE